MDDYLALANVHYCQNPDANPGICLWNSRFDCSLRTRGDKLAGDQLADRQANAASSWPGFD